MRKAIILSLMMLVGISSTACAQSTRPIQLAIFNPVQLFPEADSIHGLSLGLLYSSNADVKGVALNFGLNRATGDMAGVEMGLANWAEGAAYGWQAGFLNRAGSRNVGVQTGAVNITTGNMTGVEFGFVNWNDGFLHGVQAGAFNYAGGRFVGLQDGFINVSSGEFTGAALGLVNYAEGSVKGFQGGFVNSAGEMHGVQIGLFNHTRSLDGIQVGLLNYNGNKRPFEFMVLVNWSF